MIGNQDKCQNCENNKLIPILSLGHLPPCHAHLTKESLKQSETTFPLNIVYCNNCQLIQLDYIVDPKVIFYPDYPYFTGVTNMLVRNFMQLAETTIKNYDLKENDLVIDIGSNDGTLLKGFQEKGLKVLGVEPTKVANVAIKNGIPTLNEFFTKDTVDKILKNYGKAKIVTATNVFAHIPDPAELVNNIKNILTDDGVFISESQYFFDTVEKLQFDCIYHEHLRYYTLKPLIKLFSNVGMSIIDAEKIESAGGSIRVYVKKGDHPQSERVNELIKKEEQLGLYDQNKLKEFAQKAIKAKHNLLNLLIEKKKAGKIVGIGAPGRSNTLLGFARIDNQLIDYACERKGSPKIGLITPGSHIPIVDEEILFKEQPEFALLLSWHIGNELMKKLRGLGYKGTFIMPLPTPRIVTEV